MSELVEIGSEGQDKTIAMKRSTDPEEGLVAVPNNDDDETKEEEKEMGDVVGEQLTEELAGRSVRPISGSVAANLNFRDHHSLTGPSSSLIFQTKRYQVYPQRNSEFVLRHDRETNTVTARRGKDGSVGLSGLRFLYSMIALFMAGFLFVFCLQLLLFLFLGLTVGTGLTSQGVLIDWSQFFGTLASVPLFVYSLACALALAAAFVQDSWGGHEFFNHATKFKGVKMQWTAFGIFLGVPMIVAIASLFARAEMWWQYTALTWFSCVFALYCVFCILVIYYEIMGTLELIRKYEHYKEVDSSTNLWELIKYTLLMRQVQRFSGRKYYKYILDGNAVFKVRASSAARENTIDVSIRQGWYSKLTQWKKLQEWNLVVETEDVRQFSMDETRDMAPFVTQDTWSLEKLFCRSRNKKYIAVINGPNALKRDQIMSSFICALIGNVLVVLFVGAFLNWLGSSVGTVIFVIVIVGLLMISPVRQTIKMFQMIRDHREAKALDNEKKKKDDATSTRSEMTTTKNEIIYQLTESYRINKITPRVAWTLMALEIIIFYLWPMIALFVIGNTPIALFFLLSGAISLVRHYFNAASVLREVGDFSVLDEEITKKDQSGLHVTKQEESVIEGDFYEKARLNLIVGKISHGNRRNVWVIVFAAVVGIFCSLFLGAYVLGSNEGSGGIPKVLPAEDFRYAPENALPYPTCRMSSEIAIPGEEDTALMDFTYLSVIAYSDSSSETNNTQDFLDAWFGADFAKDEVDVVKEFREKNKISSAVQFKLISFPNLTVQSLNDATEGFAVLTIRGTNNGWDALSDAQLWSAAWLSQAVRFLLPFGEIWDPILESLIYVISQIQSSALKDVAYYQQTRDFVEYLKENRAAEFGNLRITGHSLGGGLAAITGCQTQTPAIPLSGPNNLLSRRTFDPPITKDELDSLVFNIIPDKDPVPRIDDVAELYQRIHCTASDANFVDCHTSTRSLCEIMVKCGNHPNPGNSLSSKRPILCDCHKEFKYDIPTQVGGDKTYEQVCGADVSNE